MIHNLFGDKVAEVIRDGSSNSSGVGRDNCAIGVCHEVATGKGSNGLSVEVGYSRGGAQGKSSDSWGSNGGRDLKVGTLNGGLHNVIHMLRNLNIYELLGGFNTPLLAHLPGDSTAHLLGDSRACLPGHIVAELLRNGNALLPGDGVADLPGDSDALLPGDAEGDSTALLSGDRMAILPGDVLAYRDRNLVAHLPGDLHRDFVAGLPGDLVALLVRMGLGSIARSIGMALAKDTSLARSISVSFASIAIATVTVSRL